MAVHCDRAASDSLVYARHRLVRGTELDILHDQELISTPPRDNVAGPKAVRNASCDCLEVFVTGEVPESVVDGLEVVAVDECQAPVRAGILLGERGKRTVPVIQPCELIGVGLISQGLGCRRPASAAVRAASLRSRKTDAPTAATPAIAIMTRANPVGDDVAIRCPASTSPGGQPGDHGYRAGHRRRGEHGRQHGDYREDTDIRGLGPSR